MDEAHKETDKKLLRIEREIHRIFGKCAKEVEAEADAFFASFAEKDKKKRELVKAGALSRNDYTKWRRMQIMVGARYRNLVNGLTAESLEAYKAAVAYTNGRLPDIYALNYNYIGKDIARDVKGYSYEIVNPDVVANLASRKRALLPYKVVNKQKFERWSRAKTNSIVLGGIIKGDSPYDIAKSLIRVVGMSENTAITNARTMVTSAQNGGRVDSMRRAEKMGVMIAKKWLTIHDARRRDWHAELDGAVVPVDGTFENAYGKIRFPGDPNAHPANVYNCRCTLGRVTLGYKKVPEDISLEDLYGG